MPLDWTLPTTAMLPAVISPLPLTEIAEDELESTSTGPLTSIWAFPDRLKADAALAFRTNTEVLPDGANVMVSVPLTKAKV